MSLIDLLRPPGRLSCQDSQPFSLQHLSTFIWSVLHPSLYFFTQSFSSVRETCPRRLSMFHLLYHCMCQLCGWSVLVALIWLTSVMWCHSANCCSNSMRRQCTSISSCCWFCAEFCVWLMWRVCMFGLRLIWEVYRKCKFDLFYNSQFVLYFFLHSFYANINGSGQDKSTNKVSGVHRETLERDMVVSQSQMTHTVPVRSPPTHCQNADRCARS